MKYYFLLLFVAFAVFTFALVKLSKKHHYVYPFWNKVVTTIGIGIVSSAVAYIPFLILDGVELIDWTIKIIVGLTSMEDVMKLFEEIYKNVGFKIALALFVAWKILGNFFKTKEDVRSALLKCQNYEMFEMVFFYGLEIVLLITPLFALKNGELSFLYVVTYFAIYKLWDNFKEYWGNKYSFMFYK